MAMLLVTTGVRFAWTGANASVNDSAAGGVFQIQACALKLTTELREQSSFVRSPVLGACAAAMQRKRKLKAADSGKKHFRSPKGLAARHCSRGPISFI